MITDVSKGASPVGMQGWGKDWKYKWITVCVCVCVCVCVRAHARGQSCPTLCNTMDCSLPGSSVHGIFQASVLEWVAISSSRLSSQPRNQTSVSCMTGRFFTIWTTWEALEKVKAPKSGLQIQVCFFIVYCEGKTKSTHSLYLDWMYAWILLYYGSGEGDSLSVPT